MEFLLAYVVFGGVFGIAFVLAGVQRVDANADNAGIGFRAIVLPGVAALWPWLLYRWIRAIKPANKEGAE